THRNVIRIFDLGVADGLHFITMDFVAGHDLNSLLEKRKFSQEETVNIIVQVAEALDAAHAETVVHRDLKPHNIMVTDAGKVFVMDFGLARTAESAGITRTGALLGTPAYMSPEQAKGAPLDTRSDLFSLGIIFYEMLTGQVPFQADTMLAMLLKRTQEPPVPPAQVNPEIPQVLSDIVMRCLAIDPAQRYQTARELIQDLNIYRGESPSGSTASGGVLLPRTGSSSGRSIILPHFRLASDSTAWKWISLSLAVALILMIGAFVTYKVLNKPAAAIAPMTVIIADFDNHTGESIFTGTLESSLKLVLQGASFINAYDRTRL